MNSLATDRICIIGAGAAGLITAHTLIQDGYQHVEVLTRDPTPGGIWSAGRVYEGLIINKYVYDPSGYRYGDGLTAVFCSIQGEYRFSNLDTPPPSSASSDRRLSGQDLQAYMAKFVELFLPDRSTRFPACWHDEGRESLQGSCSPIGSTGCLAGARGNQVQAPARPYLHRQQQVGKANPSIPRYQRVERQAHRRTACSTKTYNRYRVRPHRHAPFAHH